MAIFIIVTSEFVLHDKLKIELDRMRRLSSIPCSTIHLKKCSKLYKVMSGKVFGKVGECIRDN
jgi:hypothetical protein